MNSLKIYLIDKIDALGKSWLTLKGSYNKAYILQFDPTKLIVSICKKNSTYVYFYQIRNKSKYDHFRIF